jgi:hypothetical protein
MPNMVYPHVTNSTAAVNRYEPVVASNFNAHFVLLNKLKAALGDYSFLSEYVKNLNNLFIEKAAGTIEGGYKTVKFRYDSNEKETFFEIESAFFNFLDSESRMLVYNALVLWSRFKFNMLTGEKTLKRDYADANIVGERFNRDGTIYWRRVAHGVFPTADLSAQDLNYTEHEMTELTTTFNADYVTDVTNDPRLVAPE